MRHTLVKTVLALVTAVVVVVVDGAATAQEADSGDQVIFGFKVRAGGRYDNVRMCVGSPAGTKGGPAMDISFYTEIGVKDGVSIVVDLPVMRPILFAAAFKMLQFEPDVGLIFRKETENGPDIVAGPTLGLSLHYGPDYNSERSGDGRTDSFFALGPRVGGYFGLDFTRPQETFNFQLGIHPYVTPIFAVNDDEDHKGIIAGATLDALFRFDAKN